MKCNFGSGLGGSGGNGMQVQSHDFPTMVHCFTKLSYQ